MAVKAQNISFLLSQVRTSTTSLVGGKVYAYASGGTTPKSIWLDRDKQTLAANPYTLDANGTAQIYADGIYRIVIKDSAGVTKFDRSGLMFQDITGSGISNVLDYGAGTLAEAIAAIGSTPATLAYGTDQTLAANTSIPATLELMPLNGAVINHSTYTISYSGPPNRNLRFSGSGAVAGFTESWPEQFGATGLDNAAVNDTTAFTAAANALIEGGILHADGVYRIAATLPKYQFTIQGLSPGQSALVNYGAAGYALTVGYLPFDGLARPQSFYLKDISIYGQVAAARTHGVSGTAVTGSHGVNLKGVLLGGMDNVEFSNVDIGFSPQYCFSAKFSRLLFRNYNTGIIGDAAAVSNNNVYEAIKYEGGNAGQTATPFNDTGIAQSIITDLVVDGSYGCAPMDITHGAGNTWINPRWEKSTAITATSYVNFGGIGNTMINPVITTLVDGTHELTTGYYIIVSGSSNEINRLNHGGIAKRLVQLTAASANNKIRLDTTAIQNQVPSNLWIDYGTNNLIDINGNDFQYNNEVTWSTVPIQNNFLETTDFSAAGGAVSGLTKTVVTGADSRIGPFKEGLIYGFTAPSGAKTWTQDVAPADGKPINGQLVAFSVWAKSSDGQALNFLMGRAAALTTAASILIPNDKFVRVVVFYKYSTFADADFTVGVQDTGTNGFSLYGPQVTYLGITGTNLPDLYAGGFVPTESVYARDPAPNYSQNRKHKVAPDTDRGGGIYSGTGYAGMRIGKIKPVVGQPKGWLGTVTASPGTWVSEGNL